MSTCETSEIRVRCMDCKHEYFNFLVTVIHNVSYSYTHNVSYSYTQCYHWWRLDMRYYFLKLSQNSKVKRERKPKSIEGQAMAGVEK